MVDIKRVTTLFLLILLLFSPFVFAGEIFKDLDGDGINDEFQDINNNTIPDKFENNQQTPSNDFTGFSSTGAIDDFSLLTLPQKYALNFNRVSSLTQYRLDFDREFNTRLGGASSGGGSCAGGLCF